MSEWVDRKVGRSAWREAGTGHPLVFLHGLGGTRGSWNPQLEFFASTHRCLAWDMPGYGDSAQEEPLTYQRIAARLIEFFDDANVEIADVVGLSFGGMHAMHAAIRNPDRLRKLVLTNTSPAFGMNGTVAADWIRERLEPIQDGETPASMAPGVLDAISGAPLSPQIRADLIEAFGRISVAGFEAAVRCLPHNDIRDELDSIAHPALVVVGDLDAETPVSYARVLADGLVDAKLETLHGVGHLAPSEAPAAFNELVKEFL
jgi:3-oxoadipate enol-lactonase